VTLRFGVLAADPAAPVEELALGIAAEFRPVEADAVRDELDVLGDEVAARRGAGGPEADVAALAGVLGQLHGFSGDEEEYDHPDNSFLDLVLARRRGLPILLSTVYVACARRAGIPLAGVGLPGHFVVAHLGPTPPLLLDPFAGGRRVAPDGEPPRPWSAHATALRILNNLVGSYTRRGDLRNAIRAANLRLALPAEGRDRDALAAEALALQARLN
jgi:Transglutaminase-like superfamily